MGRKLDICTTVLTAGLVVGALLACKKKEEPPPPKAPERPAPPMPRDDWSLIRAPDGKAGWVLTRALIMAIPDEVAQYAEGHRITSYFSLGEVRDGEQIKHNWLWTTLSSRLQPYQFDSFRVFSWSLRRHRYETTYIERRLTGYLPAEARRVEESASDAVGSDRASAGSPASRSP